MMKPKYIICFACTLLLGFAVSWWLKTPNMVEGVNHLIEKEVPSRASVAQVEAFLDSHKIVHSEIFDEPEVESDFRYNPKLDGKRERVRGVVGAIIRNVEYGFLISWDICIKFYFDEHDRLVEYTVTKIATEM
jgi:hypothetical protein